jgi:hypothetical protein
MAQATAPVSDSTLDPADPPEGRGNAGGIVESFFHPSRPSGFGYLIQRNPLACRQNMMRGAGWTPIHPGNPG